MVDPKIEEHRGRTVKNTGDGLLAEFPSVVDAVRCAVEIQRRMIEREPEVLDEQRIRFRIGVNLGDVIVEEQDIFGDGVNVAARLAGCGKSRDFGKTVMKRARNRSPGLIKSTGYEGAKGDESGCKHHRPTFSAAC